MFRQKKINMNKFQEIREELRIVLTGRSGFVDTLIPPIMFVLVNTFFNLQVALWAALGFALVVVIYRLLNRQSFLYAFGGAAGVAIAAFTASLLGRVQGFFVPSIVSGGFSVFLCVFSILIKRPLVAYTSFVTRRWPLKWYWHPKVRPAYNEVTWIWFIFFVLRLILQLNLIQDERTGLSGVFQILTGWPATIILLIISYLYGIWRLHKLGGPSVEEFKAGVEPPWEGQKRGF